MIKNYLKVAMRNLWKHRSFSLINTFGLSLSMSVCMIIIMLVYDQKNVDGHLPHANQMFRITTTDLINTGPFSTYATAPLPMVDKIQQTYGGLSQVTRVRTGFGNDWVGIGQDVNIPVAGFFVDPEFLDLFEYDLQHGTSTQALGKPNSVVLKEETARKLFADNDPIGKVIHVGDLGDYIVTGVIKETEGKSHIKFDALASFSSLVQLEKDSLVSPTIENWRNTYNGYIYANIASDDELNALRENMRLIEAEVYGEMEDKHFRFDLQPLLAITPGPLMANEIGPTLPNIFAYFLAGMALVVMISASFNYMNLSIARALTRAKEVGIRKATGASKLQLVSQFLTEAVVLSLVAMVFSYMMLQFLKPAFDSLNFSQFLHWELSDSWGVHGIIVLFSVLTGLLSGIFPAFVLSSFEPIKVLKDLSGIRLLSKIGIRKVLIVAQFSLSFVFIVSVTLISKQMQKMLHADFGFNTENVINIRLNQARFNDFKQALSQESSIKNISGSTHIPAGGTISTDDLWDITATEVVETNTFVVDEDYANTMGLSFVAGTNFQRLDANANEVILNETAIQRFGFADASQAIGEFIIDADTVTQLRIVGVVTDYHHAMLIMDIGPMALRYGTDLALAHLQIVPGNEDQAIAAASTAFSEISDGQKMDYMRMDAELTEYYDLLFGDIVRIVGLSSALALTIACLGLLGIATYSVETRMKEVSIRKVLGASQRSLIFQLSKGFLGLLILAILISIPIAYGLNNLWLQQIAYRVPISAGVILAAIGILLLVGSLTIITQTLRAGNASPVSRLRNE